MEGLIVLLLLAILALPVILLVWVKVSTGNLIHQVINKLNYLNAKVDQLEKKKEVKKEVEPESEDEKVIINESLLDLMGDLPIEEENKVEEEEKRQKNIEVRDEKVEKLISSKSFIRKYGESQESKEKKESKEKVDKKQEEKVKQKMRQAAFVKPSKNERNWEQFIGENLINKIGIGILVLGIVYFVRYAIDKNWINEVGRVAIGILAGGLLTFIAHKIRKTYTAFSSVLVGGAMAVFYYTISIGFHNYGLFSQPVAFGLMVLITGFSVLLSISYDRKELAILALLGAFSTPLMISNGEGNYIVLFSYLAIVNVGMLVLAYFKKWNIVNILSFAFTVMLYGSWFASNIVGVVGAPYQGAFLFVSLFYMIFFFMHIINNVKEQRKFKGYEFGLMLGTTALYYAAGMSLLHLSGNDNMRGLFTVGLGVYNLLFAFPLYKRNNVDKSLIFLLIGMVLTFVSLAAPVQLTGNNITLFWTAEMVLLLWLGQKSNIKFMKLSSILILGLMIISLLMDWQQIYFDYGRPSIAIIINKGFITTMFSVVGVWAYLRLLNNEKEKYLSPDLSVVLMKNFSKIIMASMLYLIGVIEITFQITDRMDYTPLASLCAMSYTYLFLIGLMVYSKKTTSFMLNKGIVFVSAIALLTFPLFNEIVKVIRYDYLMGEVGIGVFVMQYLNIALILVVGVQFFKTIQKDYGLRTDAGKGIVLGLSVIGLIVASMQLSHQTLILFFNQQANNMSFINNQTIKIGYPIVWGITSFILMLIGMKYKYRMLRIISLSVFSILLLKLFLFDIKGASEAGKIVAFILLGVLLLVISFMYQKLKNLVFDNGSENK
jgi:uncharacterized membrane protein